MKARLRVKIMSQQLPAAMKHPQIMLKWRELIEGVLVHDYNCSFGHCRHNSSMAP